MILTRLFLIGEKEQTKKLLQSIPSPLEILRGDFAEVADE